MSHDDVVEALAVATIPIASTLDRRVVRAQGIVERLADVALTLATNTDAKDQALSLLVTTTELEHELLDIQLETARRGAALDARAVQNAALVRQADCFERLAVALAESMTSDQVAVTIATEALTALQANTVSVFLPDASGHGLDMIGSINLPHEMRAEFERVTLDMPIPITHAHRENAPVFLESLAATEARFAFALEPLRRMRSEALAAVPFNVGDGERGVLAITYEKPHALSAEEQRFVVTLGRLCAQAMVRARLFDSNRRERERAEAAQRRAEAAAERLDRLHHVTSALCGALTEVDVADVAINEGLATTGAFGGGLVLLSEDGQEFITLRQVGIQPHIAERFARFPRSTPCMARDVLKTGALFMSFAEYVERYDTLGVQSVAPWTGARAAVPLQTTHGPLGALTFIFENEREFDDQDRAYFRALADQCTLALERVRFGRQAEEARTAKAQFLATTSHELRTPLTVILGNLDLLEEGCLGPGPERWRQAISRVHASSGHLLSLVEDLLRFVDVSRGEVRSHRENCDARDIITRALGSIEDVTDERGIRIVRDLPDEPLPLQTDCVKVEQILTNLIVNAGRFVKDGEIRVAARSEGDTLVVEVSDTGAGIPPEQHERVFHPFVQIDQSYTRRVGGLGLGLSVARELARFLHGDLTLDTRTSKGTMFRLTLPAARRAVGRSDELETVGANAAVPMTILTRARRQPSRTPLP